MKPLEPRRRAFTIIEILAVVMLIGVMVGLLLPAVQSARESARRTSCGNHLLQLGLAVAGYHSSFQQLPTQLSGTDGSPIVGMDNDRRLSYLVPLLSFVNNRPLWEKINAPLNRQKTIGGLGSAAGYETMAMSDEEPDEDSPPWVAGGPEPFQENYGPWMMGPAEFRCPSDPGIGLPSMGRTNYAACLGDGLVGANSGPYREVNGLFVFDEVLAAQTEISMRGMFMPRRTTRLDDTTDGLSNTLLLGEIATGLGDSSIRTSAAQGPGEEILRDHPDWAYHEDRIDQERPEFWSPLTKDTNQGGSGQARGHRWADGMPLYTAFNTILVPNTAIVVTGSGDNGAGVMSASSRHQSGAHVCFGDGAVRFITDSIDAGDRSQATVYLGGSRASQKESPYGLWGALGTRAGQELVLAERVVD